MAKPAGERRLNAQMAGSGRSGLNTTMRYNSDTKMVMSPPTAPAERAFEKNGVNMKLRVSCGVMLGLTVSNCVHVRTK